jgi:hypothetical protein
MRVGNTLLALTLQASLNPVTANRFVGYNGEQATVQGQKVAGVAQYDQVVGMPYAATAIGTEFVEASGVINIGDPIISDSVGRAMVASALGIAAGAVAVTSAAANGSTDIVGSEPTEHLLGYALSAATAAGQWVEVHLK